MCPYINLPSSHLTPAPRFTHHCRTCLPPSPSPSWSPAIPPPFTMSVAPPQAILLPSLPDLVSVGISLIFTSPCKAETWGESSFPSPKLYVHNNFNFEWVCPWKQFTWKQWLQIVQNCFGCALCTHGIILDLNVINYFYMQVKNSYWWVIVVSCQTLRILLHSSTQTRHK